MQVINSCNKSVLKTLKFKGKTILMYKNSFKKVFDFFNEISKKFTLLLQYLKY